MSEYLMPDADEYLATNTGECLACWAGRHEDCTDDGVHGSASACECARGSGLHGGPNGIGVV